MTGGHRRADAAPCGLWQSTQSHRAFGQLMVIGPSWNCAQTLWWGIPRTADLIREYGARTTRSAPPFECTLWQLVHDTDLWRGSLSKRSYVRGRILVTGQAKLLAHRHRRQLRRIADLWLHPPDSAVLFRQDRSSSCSARPSKSTLLCRSRRDQCGLFPGGLGDVFVTSSRRYPSGAANGGSTGGPAAAWPHAGKAASARQAPIRAASILRMHLIDGFDRAGGVTYGASFAQHGCIRQRMGSGR